MINRIGVIFTEIEIVLFWSLDKMWSTIKSRQDNDMIDDIGVVCDENEKRKWRDRSYESAHIEKEINLSWHIR